MSQARALAGHRFMTNISNGPDLEAIARDAEFELEEEQAVDALQQDDPRSAYELGGATGGYYEAELSSLRDAAMTLDEAETGG